MNSRIRQNKVLFKKMRFKGHFSQLKDFTSSTMSNGRQQRCAIKKQKPKSAICTSLITCLLPIVQCMLDFSSTDIMHMNETMTVTRSYKMNVALVIKHSSQVHPQSYQMIRSYRSIYPKIVMTLDFTLISPPHQ